MTQNWIIFCLPKAYLSAARNLVSSLGSRNKKHSPISRVSLEHVKQLILLWRKYKSFFQLTVLVLFCHPYCHIGNSIAFSLEWLTATESVSLLHFTASYHLWRVMSNRRTIFFFNDMLWDGSNGHRML